MIPSVKRVTWSGPTTGIKHGTEITFAGTIPEGYSVLIYIPRVRWNNGNNGVTCFAQNSATSKSCTVYTTSADCIVAIDAICYKNTL